MILNDGRVVCWGKNDKGQGDINIQDEEDGELEGRG